MKLREATKRLYAQLKEMEKRHQEEREKLQVCLPATLGPVGSSDSFCRLTKLLIHVGNSYVSLQKTTNTTM